jgi:hypothetical protein
VLNEQAASVPFGLVLEPPQSPMEVVDPPVRPVLQPLQDGGIENEQGQHRFPFLKRVQQAVVIREPKISSEPMDADAGPCVHRRRM